MSTFKFCNRLNVCANALHYRVDTFCLSTYNEEHCKVNQTARYQFERLTVLFLELGERGSTHNVRGRG